MSLQGANIAHCARFPAHICFSSLFIKPIIQGQDPQSSVRGCPWTSLEGVQSLPFEVSQEKWACKPPNLVPNGGHGGRVARGLSPQRKRSIRTGSGEGPARGDRVCQSRQALEAPRAWRTAEIWKALMN